MLAVVAAADIILAQLAEVTVEEHPLQPEAEAMAETRVLLVLQV